MTRDPDPTPSTLNVGFVYMVHAKGGATAHASTDWVGCDAKQAGWADAFCVMLLELMVPLYVFV